MRRAGVIGRGFGVLLGLAAGRPPAASAVADAAMLRKLMLARGLPVPPEGRTLASFCVTDLCQ